MNLVLPVPTVTSGPTYAFQEVTAFTVIDSHNHTPGMGLQVPTAGLSIDADLSFQSHNATLLRTARFDDLASAPALGTDLSAVSSVNGDLYWNNGTGFPVQITAGNGLNATSIGGIGGDYATSPASVFYTQIAATFTFWQNTNQSAALDAGPLTIRKLTAASPGITLSAPAGLSGSYGITFPLANPGSTKLVGWDSTGNLLPAYSVDNSSIEFNGSLNLQVKAGGVTAAMLVPNIALAGNISTTGNLTVGDALSDTLTVGGTGGVTLTRTSFVGGAGLSFTDTSVNDYALFPGGTAKAGLFAITASTMGVSDFAGTLLGITTSSSTAAHRTIIGAVRGDNGDEVSPNNVGYTSVRNTTGTYTVTYSLTFSQVPIVTVTSTDVGSSAFPSFPQIVTQTASGFVVKTYQPDVVGNFSDSGFTFHVAGVK